MSHTCLRAPHFHFNNLQLPWEVSCSCKKQHSQEKWGLHWSENSDLCRTHVCFRPLQPYYRNAYLGRWQRSGWWGVWVVRWWPAAQTPCGCVQLPDTALPSSWNSRSGLWFGKPADPHLAGNQQRQDGDLDEQRGGAANPLLFSFSTTEAQFIIFCKLNAENTVYHRLWTLISGLFLCSAHVTQCTAEVKNKLLLEDESFWCTILQQGRAALLRDQFGQQKLFHHSRLHFLLRGSKIIALSFLALIRARSSTAKKLRSEHGFIMYTNEKANK